jgi:hypothetical protein
MKDNHTKGPWKVVEFGPNSEGESGYVIQDQNEYCLAWLFFMSRNAFGAPTPTRLPVVDNSKLMAAAPSLLDVLNRAAGVVETRFMDKLDHDKDCLKDHTKWLKRVHNECQALIAYLEGRPYDERYKTWG